MAEEKTVQLRVTRRHHTHKGKTYRVGEEFPGTERLLKTFGDRLELATVSKAQDEAKTKPEAKKNADASGSK